MLLPQHNKTIQPGKCKYCGSESDHTILINDRFRACKSCFNLLIAPIWITNLGWAQEQTDKYRDLGISKETRIYSEVETIVPPKEVEMCTCEYICEFWGAGCRKSQQKDCPSAILPVVIPLKVRYANAA
ncbi:hypothetical protein ISS03_04770 [Patescibacteria group bacterium]|nr:hypothetical protein [Patescibacteria group bacterium]